MRIKLNDCHSAAIHHHFCLSLLSCYSIKLQPVLDREWDICCTLAIVQLPIPNCLLLVWWYATRACLLKTTICFPIYQSAICLYSSAGLFICCLFVLFVSLCLPFCLCLFPFACSLFLSPNYSTGTLCIHANGNQ